MSCLSQKIEYITSTLNKLYPQPSASLTFNEDPFTMLVATILSARCTDARVNEIAPTLFKLADSPQAMVKLSVNAIQAVIRPCGLSTIKANNIWQLSRQLCESFDGKVPCNFKELEKLPGVGHKTASVVLGHVFHQATFPVDTHIQRLSIRWGLVQKTSVKHVEQQLKTIFPKTSWFKIHLQMIFYGREHCNRFKCQPKHLCTICQQIANTKDFTKI